MRKSYKLQVLILFLFLKVNGQNRLEYIIDSCKIIIDNKLEKNIKLSKSYYTIKFNTFDSYVKIDLDNNNDKIIKIRVCEAKNHSDMFANKNYNLYFNFIYDIVYKGYTIHKVSFNSSNSNVNPSFSLINNLIIKIKKQKIIGLYKVIKIGKLRNFKTNSFYEINEDARWKGKDFYEEDEKKWKITWTIKEKNILKDGTQIGFRVLKIDAQNGKILSEFIEFPTD